METGVDRHSHPYDLLFRPPPPALPSRLGRRSIAPGRQAQGTSPIEQRVGSYLAVGIEGTAPGSLLVCYMLYRIPTGFEHITLSITEP